MSMLCSLYRIDENQTRSLLAAPELIIELFGNSPISPKGSFLSRIFGRSKKEASSNRSKLSPIAESETYELDQAWHILHYLFSGRDTEGDWPSSFIMSGGQEIGPDLGYGPARLFNNELSVDVATFLKGQSRQSFEAAYDAQKIEEAQIYWQVSSELDDRRRQIEELWEIVLDLRSFTEETVRLRGSMLIQIY